MAKRSKSTKVIIIDPKDLVTPDIAAWCSCGKGYLQCVACGAKIRVGGTMVDSNGKERKRAWAPWKWWNKHIECGRRGRDE